MCPGGNFHRGPHEGAAGTVDKAATRVRGQTGGGAAETQGGDREAAGLHSSSHGQSKD